MSVDKIHIDYSIPSAMISFDMTTDAFEEHWHKVLEKSKNNPDFEVVELGWEQHVLVDHKNNLVYRYPKNKSAASKLLDEVDILGHLNKMGFNTKIPRMRNLNSEYAVYDYIEGDVLTPELLNKLSDNDFKNIGREIGLFFATLHNADKQIVKNKKTQQTMSLLEYYQKRIQSGKTSRYYPEAKKDLDELVSYEKSDRVVVHGDLHGLNIVINPDTKQLAGVIDFSEVEIGSPNQDFRKIFMAHEKLLDPAIKSYSQASNHKLNRRRILIWAYVNEWANVCYFDKTPQNPTYIRAYNHLQKWGVIA